MNKTYREELAQAIGEIEGLMRENFKSNGTPIPFTYGGQTYDLRNRQARVSVIDRITDDYVRQHGEFNDAAKSAYYARGGTGEGPATVPVDYALLDRLADVLLYEELTDENPHKVAHAEYPFMSEWQLDLRRERESVEVADTEGADGKSYRQPTRRKRNGYETWYVDHHAKGRNKERQEQYRKDTAPGAVTTYNLYETGGVLSDEFVNCSGLGKRWFDEMSAVNETEIIPSLLPQS